MTTAPGVSWARDVVGMSPGVVVVVVGGTVVVVAPFTVVVLPGAAVVVGAFVVLVGDAGGRPACRTGRNRSWAVWPTMARARSRFFTPGICTTMLLPWRLMSGSATPR